MPEGGLQPGMGNIVYIEPDPVEIEGEGGVLRLQSADREIGRVVAITSDIFSSSLITKRVATAIVQVEVDNSRITATNSSTAPGGYLQAPLNIGDDIVYISNTGRFSSNGKLLVGNEVIRYLRKERTDSLVSQEQLTIQLSRTGLQEHLFVKLKIM